MILKLDNDPLEPFISERHSDGELIDKKGCSHDSGESLLQTGVLGFCGCGRPEDNLRYVRNGLRHIVAYGDDGVGATDWWAQASSLFGSKESAYFFFYWADNEGLTKHGSSVPGWLDTKGEDLLTALESLDLDDEDDQPATS